MTDTKEMEDVIMVYMGCRLDGKHKLFPIWMMVTETEFKRSAKSGTSRIYKASTAVKRYLMGTPGTCYSVEQVLGTTEITVSKAKYLGLWGNRDDRMEWQAEHRVATTCYDTRQRAKKEGKQDDFSALLPFRKMYQHASTRDRQAAILANVIAYITKYTND